jgi:hypothetical protein
MNDYQLYATQDGLEMPLISVKATSIEEAVELGKQVYAIGNLWTLIAKKVGA